MIKRIIYILLLMTVQIGFAQIIPTLPVKPKSENTKTKGEVKAKIKYVKKPIYVEKTVYVEKPSEKLSLNPIFIYTKDHPKGYFKKIDNSNWGEFNFFTGEKIYSFYAVQELNNIIILYDKGRNMYVKLTESECFWGNSYDNIPNKIYDGKWVEK